MVEALVMKHFPPTEAQEADFVRGRQERKADSFQLPVIIAKQILYLQIKCCNRKITFQDFAKDLETVPVMQGGLKFIIRTSVGAGPTTVN